MEFDHYLDFYVNMIQMDVFCFYLKKNKKRDGRKKEKKKKLDHFFQSKKNKIKHKTYSPNTLPIVNCNASCAFS